MPTTGQNEAIRRGDHKKVRFEIDVEELEGDFYWYLKVVFDTGATFKADDPLIEKNNNDITFENGEIIFDINSIDTQPLTKRTYKHELRIRDSLDNVSTLARGEIKIF